MFEDLSQPANLFVLPREVEVTYDTRFSNSERYTKRRCREVADQNDDVDQLEQTLARVSQNCYLTETSRTKSLKYFQKFSQVDLSMSRLSPLTVSCTRSDLETNTSMATCSGNIKFAPNRHRDDLPIFKHRERIIQNINENPVTFITGKTGKFKLR